MVYRTVLGLHMGYFSRFRAAIILVVIGLVLAALIGRVGYLQTYGRQKPVGKVDPDSKRHQRSLTQWADGQQHQTDTLVARRGSIYDACGNMLAGTVQTRSLYIDPRFFFEQLEEQGYTDAEVNEAVGKLAAAVELKADELAKRLKDREDSQFLRLADNLDESTCKAITNLGLPGVGLMGVNQRYYPMGSLAAHILGGVGSEGNGLEGLEMKFEKTLAGSNGLKRTMKDARRRGIYVAADDYIPPRHGHHLILTIDANIQMMAEQELAAACETNKAKRGEVIVMDPQTGDVLALANWPTFNPQSINDSPKETRRNNCLVSPFEPGSVIKPFIVGPALQWHITRPEEMWPIPGISWTTNYGRRITDVHGYGRLAMWDVLVKSSNIGMCMLGERMGNANLYKALKGFELGKATGIELPGEDPGLLHALEKWGRASTDSVSQGYELMVTPMQLARAFCAYANGGKLVQPHIIKGTLDPEGTLIEKRPPVALESLPQAVDPLAAAQIKRILCDVTFRGTATGAGKECKYWNIFGKTGTAHISQGKGGYSASKFNSSFMGAAPAENPRLVAVFIVHEPDRSIAHYGGTVSAPAAGRFFFRALSYLQAPQSPILLPPPPNVASVLFNFNPKVYNREAKSTGTHE